MLQEFARDIQWQIAGVHQSAHEAQIAGQELLGNIQNKDPAHIEFDALAFLTAPQIKGRAAGNKEQQDIFASTFHPAVEKGQRVFKVMR